MNHYSIDSKIFNSLYGKIFAGYVFYQDNVIANKVKLKFVSLKVEEMILGFLSYNKIEITKI